MLFRSVSQIPNRPQPAPTAIHAPASASRAAAPVARTVNVGPAVAVTIAPPEPVPPAAPEPAHPRARTPLQPVKPVVPALAAPRADDPLGAELALIQNAADALRLGRHAVALRLLDEHAARYPAGALREERMGLRVLALCGSGDTRLGELERQRFLTSAPRSVLADKVRQACGANPSVDHPELGPR